MLALFVLTWLPLKGQAPVPDEADNVRQELLRGGPLVASAPAHPVIYRFPFAHWRLDIVMIPLTAVGVALLCLAFTPRRIYQEAWKNRGRLDGQHSRRRMREEAVAFMRYFWDLLWVPGIGAVIVVSIATAIHYYIIPLPTAYEIFSLYHPDRQRWEQAMEEGRLGDLGAHYEAWAETRGYDYQTMRFWQQFLWNTWPVWILIGGVLIGGAWWIIQRGYRMASSAYLEGILERRTHWTLSEKERLRVQSRKKKGKHVSSASTPTPAGDV